MCQDGDIDKAKTPAHCRGFVFHMRYWRGMAAASAPTLAPPPAKQAARRDQTRQARTDNRTGNTNTWGKKLDTVSPEAMLMFFPLMISPVRAPGG